MGLLDLSGVTDYFRGTDPASRHRELYFETLRKMKNDVDAREINLILFEMALFSATERNIILSLEIPPKFRSDDMLEGLKIGSSMFSKTLHVGSGVPDIRGYREMVVSFKPQCVISLWHNKDDMIRPAPGSLAYRDDQELRSRMGAAFKGLSADQCTSSLLFSVAEKMSLKPEMRSMMLKGYLYLCDMVLCTSWKGVEIFESEQTVDVIRRPSEYNALCSMDRYSVYAHEARFSRAEFNLFCLLCCKFPKVKFSEELNIYNSFVIPAENAAVQVQSDGVKSIFLEGASPDMFWDTLTKLACKMDCLDQLHSVISDFRGMPYFLNNVGSHWSRSRAFVLKYPKSSSLVMALSTGSDCRDTITTSSNFMSTTHNIIADNLMGQCLVSSFFTFGEYLGAFGPGGCPSGKPQRDSMILSRCALYGLDEEDYRKNSLRNEWQLMKGRDIPLTFGSECRRVFCAYLEVIRRKKSVEGMFSPCLLMDITESNLVNTTWGICRGFETRDKKICVPRPVYETTRKHAFCWVNGVTDEIPIIGLSLVGDRNPYPLRRRENKFLANSEGVYIVRKINRSLDSDYELRRDVMEGMSSFIFSGQYRGGRDTVVCMKENLVQVLHEVDEETLNDRARRATGRQSARPDSERSPGDRTGLTGNMVNLDLTRAHSDGLTVRAGDLTRLRGEDRDTGMVARTGRNNVNRMSDRMMLVESTRYINGAVPILLKPDGTQDEMSTYWYVRKMADGVGKANMGNVFGVSIEGRPGSYITGRVVDRHRSLREGTACIVVPAIGDGMCGVRCLLTDFCLRGLVSVEAYKDFLGEIERSSGACGWHLPEELFLMVSKCNVGLVVYHDFFDATNTVVHYGVQDAEHIIRLRATGSLSERSKGGQHYDLLIPQSTGSYRIGKYGEDGFITGFRTMAQDREIDEICWEVLPYFLDSTPEFPHAGPFNAPKPRRNLPCRNPNHKRKDKAGAGGFLEGGSKFDDDGGDAELRKKKKKNPNEDSDEEGVSIVEEAAELGKLDRGFVGKEQANPKSGYFSSIRQADGGSSGKQEWKQDPKKMRYGTGEPYDPFSKSDGKGSKGRSAMRTDYKV